LEANHGTPVAASVSASPECESELLLFVYPKIQVSFKNILSQFSSFFLSPMPPHVLSDFVLVSIYLDIMKWAGRMPVSNLEI